MRKIRGVSITPVMIEDVVRGFDEVSEFSTSISSVRGLDTVFVRVEPRHVPGGDVTTLTRRITEEFKREIGIRPEVELAPEGSLPRQEWKAARLRDERALVSQP